MYSLRTSRGLSSCRSASSVGRDCLDDHLFCSSFVIRRTHRHFFMEDRPSRRATRSSAASTSTKQHKAARFPPKSVFEPPPLSRLPLAFPKLEGADVVVQAVPKERIDLLKVSAAFRELASCPSLTSVSLLVDVKEEDEQPDGREQGRLGPRICNSVLGALSTASLPGLKNLTIQSVHPVLSTRFKALAQKYGSTLTRLELYSGVGGSPSCIAMLPSFTNLRHLSIDIEPVSWWEGQNDMAPHSGLLQALGSLSTLQHLSLHSLVELDEGAFEVTRALAALPNLTSLDLPDAPHTMTLPVNTLATLSALTMPGFMLPLGTQSAELTALTSLDAHSWHVFTNNTGAPLFGGGADAGGEAAVQAIRYPRLQELKLTYMAARRLRWVTASHHLTQLHIQWLETSREVAAGAGAAGAAGGAGGGGNGVPAQVGGGGGGGAGAGGGGGGGGGGGDGDGVEGAAGFPDLDNFQWGVAGLPGPPMPMAWGGAEDQLSLLIAGHLHAQSTALARQLSSQLHRLVLLIANVMAANVQLFTRLSENQSARLCALRQGIDIVMAYHGGLSARLRQMEQEAGQPLGLPRFIFGLEHEVDVHGVQGSDVTGAGAGAGAGVGAGPSAARGVMEQVDVLLAELGRATTALQQLGAQREHLLRQTAIISDVVQRVAEVLERVSISWQAAINGARSTMTQQQLQQHPPQQEAAAVGGQPQEQGGAAAAAGAAHDSGWGYAMTGGTATISRVPEQQVSAAAGGTHDHAGAHTGAGAGGSSGAGWAAGMGAGPALQWVSAVSTRLRPSAALVGLCEAVRSCDEIELPQLIRDHCRRADELCLLVGSGQLLHNQLMSCTAATAAAAPTFMLQQFSLPSVNAVLEQWGVVHAQMQPLLRLLRDSLGHVVVVVERAAHHELPDVVLHRLHAQQGQPGRIPLRSAALAGGSEAKGITARGKLVAAEMAPGGTAGGLVGGLVPRSVSEPHVLEEEVREQEAALAAALAAAARAVQHVSSSTPNTGGEAGPSTSLAPVGMPARSGAAVAGALWEEVGPNGEQMPWTHLAAAAAARIGVLKALQKMTSAVTSQLGGHLLAPPIIAPAGTMDLHHLAWLRQMKDFGIGHVMPSMQPRTVHCLALEVAGLMPCWADTLTTLKLGVDLTTPLCTLLPSMSRGVVVEVPGMQVPAVPAAQPEVPAQQQLAALASGSAAAAADEGQGEGRRSRMRGRQSQEPTTGAASTSAAAKTELEERQGMQAVPQVSQLDGLHEHALEVVKQTYSWLPNMRALVSAELAMAVLPLTLLPPSLTSLTLTRTLRVIQDWEGVLHTGVRVPGYEAEQAPGPRGRAVRRPTTARSTVQEEEQEGQQEEEEEEEEEGGEDRGKAAGGKRGSRKRRGGGNGKGARASPAAKRARGKGAHGGAAGARTGPARTRRGRRDAGGTPPADEERSTDQEHEPQQEQGQAGRHSLELASPEQPAKQGKEGAQTAGPNAAAAATEATPAVVPPGLAQLKSLTLQSVQMSASYHPRRDPLGRSPLRCLLPILQGCTSLDVTLWVVPDVQHDPMGYDLPAITACTLLQSLRMWAAGDEEAQGRLDCRKLQALSRLPSLSRLSFTDPSHSPELRSMPGLKGLAHISSLTCLTRLTELDFGAWWLPHDNCRLLMHSLSPGQRRGALQWLQECHDEQGGGRMGWPRVPGSLVAWAEGFLGGEDGSSDEEGEEGE